jgi:acetolactate synthase-1/2/3 large subunit
MTVGRPGATHICLPYDVQKHAIAATEVWAQPGHDVVPASRFAPDPRDIERAADKLVAARSPRVHLRRWRGDLRRHGGTRGAGDPAECAVCTSVSGQGSLPGAHPLNAGVVGTNGGVAATREVVAQADLVLFIGARAGSTTTEHWQMPARDVAILHLDVDPMTIATNYRTDVALVGDARLGLAALAAAVRERIARRPGDAADGRAIVARARAAKQTFFSDLAQSRDRPIKPERVVDALNQLLPLARSWSRTLARPALTSPPISMRPRPAATSSPTARTGPWASPCPPGSVRPSDVLMRRWCR